MILSRNQLLPSQGLHENPGTKRRHTTWCRYLSMTLAATVSLVAVLAVLYLIANSMGYLNLNIEYAGYLVMNPNQGEINTVNLADNFDNINDSDSDNNFDDLQASPLDLDVSAVQDPNFNPGHVPTPGRECRIIYFYHIGYTGGESFSSLMQEKLRQYYADDEEHLNKMILDFYFIWNSAWRTLAEAEKLQLGIQQFTNRVITFIFRYLMMECKHGMIHHLAGVPPPPGQEGRTPGTPGMNLLFAKLLDLKHKVARNIDYYGGQGVFANYNGCQCKMIFAVLFRDPIDRLQSTLANNQMAFQSGAKSRHYWINHEQANGQIKSFLYNDYADHFFELYQSRHAYTDTFLNVNEAMRKLDQLFDVVGTTANFSKFVYDVNKLFDIKDVNPNKFTINETNIPHLKKSSVPMDPSITLTQIEIEQARQANAYDQKLVDLIKQKYQT